MSKGFRKPSTRKTRMLAALSGLMLAAGTSTGQAAEVAETSLEEFDDFSAVEYASSFCAVAPGDSVEVVLSTAVGDAGSLADMAKISAVEFKNADKEGKNENKNAVTPAGKEKGKTASYSTSDLAAPARSVTVTLDDADDGWHTVHLRLVLVDDALEKLGRLGVNLHSMPCEEPDDDTDVADAG